MAAPNAAAPGGPPQQSVSGMCEECLAAMPAGTKKLSAVIALGSVLGMFIGSYTFLDPEAIIRKYQIYRLFLSPFISGPGFNAIFNLISVMFVFAHGSRVEFRKGTLYFLFSSVVMALLANVLLFTVGAIFFASGGTLNTASDKETAAAGVPAGYFYSFGSFPMALAILTLECCFADEAQRRFMCFPCDVPTKAFPLAFLLLMSIFGIQFDNVFGLAAGYLVFYGDRIMPGSDRLRRWENASIFSALVASPGFVSVGNLGQVANFSPFGFGGMPGGMGMGGQQQPQARQRPVSGSGRLGNIHSASDYGGAGPEGAPSSSSSSSSSSGSGGSGPGTKPSAFSGTGYRLGGTGSSTQTQGASSGPRAPASIVDRYERLVRSGASTATSSSSSSSSSAATATTAAPSSSSSVSSEPDRSVWPRSTVALTPMPISTERDTSKSNFRRSNNNEYAPLNSEVDTMDDDDEEEAPAPSNREAQDRWASEIEVLQNLGYSEAEAIRALKSSRGDLQGAIDYLSA